MSFAATGMTDAQDEALGDVGRGLGFRLAVGLAQGLAAWALIEHAKGLSPSVAAAAALVTAYVPLIVLAAVGRMRPATLWAWSALAATILAGLAVYDLWREPLQSVTDPTVRRWPSPWLTGFSAMALYAAHHLLEPADEERRLCPSYPARFEGAWRHAFQLALSLLFTGVFWAVLQLGAALFSMIHVEAVATLLRQSWFTAPATAVAFAGAVHLTDVRPALIRGVRGVALTLMAWLLPLMAGLTAAFLATLPFTGLQALWGTGRATSLLLSAAGVLILLINAAYQDGKDRESLPRALLYAVRLAALLLAPLVALAAVSAALRIGQYGLTPERICALGAILVGAVYACGYAMAALVRGPWMRWLETANVAAAFVLVATILVLLSPVADPARIAVVAQTVRLQSGRTAPDRFDYAFLRFGAARFGRDALIRLTRSPNPAIAERAKRAAKLENRYEAQGLPEAGAPFLHAKIYPNPQALPASFRSQIWTSQNEVGGQRCLSGGGVCTLYVRDLNGDGRPEVLLDGYSLAVFMQDASGLWASVGTFANADCPGVRAALIAGEGSPVAAPVPDLEVSGVRLGFSAAPKCERRKPPAIVRGPDAPPAELGPAFARPTG